MTLREPARTGLLLRLYRGLSPALCRAANLAGPLSAKMAAGIAGRRGLMDRLAAGADLVRDGICFQVTWVGEYEQARPLIAALKARPSPPNCRPCPPSRCRRSLCSCAAARDTTFRLTKPTRSAAASNGG